MTVGKLRKKFLDFMEEKGHKIIPSASLVPENDPTVLFTTAGMHPLVPYLMGEVHPGGKRLANCQKCIRTVDIDEVGDAIHHTFFEMFGNWSLGDYFKDEAIRWSWEFLTSENWLNLDKNRIAVSVFAGDADVPFDEEAYDIWKKIFSENNLPIARIAKLPKKNNWWGPAGETGPCGPDTEMFYWTGESDKIPESFNDDSESWVEIWNDVFMEYNKNSSGKYEPLKQKNVDTGMGLERTLAVLNRFDDNYKTELFWPIIEKIEEISGKKYADFKKEFRIIADHIKAATFIIADGVTPLNIGCGYILRRLIRRAIRYGKIIGIENNFTKNVSQKIVKVYADVYQLDKEKIVEELEKEENKYNELNKRIEKDKAKELKKLYYKIIYIETAMKAGLSEEEAKKSLETSGIKTTEGIQASAQVAFNLETRNGYFHELFFEDLKEKIPGAKKSINKIEESFNEKLQKHQELSRTASVGMFKGGLADAGEKTTRLHTVAHLMLAGLRKVLGGHIIQKGSNITAERLRFDFSHNEKMTEEQKKAVENFVNESIQKNISVVCEEMGLDEAKKQGAMGIFENKYGEKVKVYTISDPETSSGLAPISREICGGPHVKNTGDIGGHFKIIKEESSSAGVRRIKAVVE